MSLVPNVLKYNDLKHISFYQYISLKGCILKGMKSSISFDNPLPESQPTKQLIIGRFFHKVMEAVYNISTLSNFKEFIEDEIQASQSYVNNWPYFKKVGSVSGWIEINNAAIYVIKRFKNKSYNNVNIERNIEVTLYSIDMLLFGRPDSYYINGSQLL